MRVALLILAYAYDYGYITISVLKRFVLFFFFFIGYGGFIFYETSSVPGAAAASLSYQGTF